MKILVTGFTPFGGETVNPSYEAVKMLPEEIGGAEICRLEIPTAFSQAAPAVAAAIERLRPDAVVSVGQAAGRKCVTVEKVAINYAYSTIPDNEGFRPDGLPLDADGPDAYFSTLPVKEMVAAVRAGGFGCELSFTAGAYVCNSVMYRTLRLAALRYPQMRAGFVHVPYADEQLGARRGQYPSMPLADIAKALECALREVALRQA